MPALIHGDEKHWAAAKKLAEAQGRKEDWPYVVGIFQRMTGRSEKSVTPPRMFAFAMGEDLQKGFELPAFVIPGQVPRVSSVPGLDAITAMPTEPLPADQRAFTDPVLTLRGITKGLPIEDTRAHAFQKFIGSIEKSSNEVVFRQQLMQHLHKDMREGDPTLRRALLQRSLSYYKSQGRPPNTRYIHDRAQGMRQTTRIEKGFVLLLEKGTGEGSRGGKVIGHTSSGKPIYEAGHARTAMGGSKKQSDTARLDQFMGAHEGWTAIDHNDARVRHMHGQDSDSHLATMLHERAAAKLKVTETGAGKNPWTGEQRHTSAWTGKPIIQKAQARGGGYHRRVTDPESGKHRYFYDADKYNERPDAHISGADAKSAAVHADVLKHVDENGVTVDDLAKKLRDKHDGQMIADAVRHHVGKGTLKYEGGLLKKCTVADTVKKGTMRANMPSTQIGRPTGKPPTPSPVAAAVAAKKPELPERPQNPAAEAGISAPRMEKADDENDKDSYNPAFEQTSATPQERKQDLEESGGTPDEKASPMSTADQSKKPQLVPGLPIRKANPMASWLKSQG